MRVISEDFHNIIPMVWNVWKFGLTKNMPLLYRAKIIKEWFWYSKIDHF